MSFHQGKSGTHSGTQSLTSSFCLIFKTTPFLMPYVSSKRHFILWSQPWLCQSVSGKDMVFALVAHIAMRFYRTDMERPRLNSHVSSVGWIIILTTLSHWLQLQCGQLVFDCKRCACCKDSNHKAVCLPIWTDVGLGCARDILVCICHLVNCWSPLKNVHCNVIV